MIPLEDCVDRRVYILKARNISIGVYDQRNECFWGLRNKMGSVFVDIENHFDSPGGTAKPLDVIEGLVVPDCIELEFDLGAYDSVTKRPVEFDSPVSRGGNGWCFSDTKEPSLDIRPVSRKNEALFNYLLKTKEYLFGMDERAAILSRPKRGITVANICTAFDKKTIGTKVLAHKEAIKCIEDYIDSFDWPENGQAVIPAPELIPVLRSGNAPISKDPDDYVLKLYRGKVDKFIKGDLAEEVAIKTCLLIVYTKDAYLADPDVAGDDKAGIPRDDLEYARVEAMDCSHVIVAIIASGSDAPSTVSPFRFVANLAGGNKDYEAYTKEDLVELAKKVRDNAGADWVSVADE